MIQPAADRSEQGVSTTQPWRRLTQRNNPPAADEYVRAVVRQPPPTVDPELPSGRPVPGDGLDLAVDEQQDQLLVVRANHQELADAVGSVREVVARTLAGFRTAGYVATQTDGIRLLDPYALAHLPR